MALSNIFFSVYIQVWYTLTCSLKPVVLFMHTEIVHAWKICILPHSHKMAATHIRRIMLSICSHCTVGVPPLNYSEELVVPSVPQAMGNFGQCFQLPR